MLRYAVRSRSLTSGGLDSCGLRELRAFPLLWFVCMAVIFRILSYDTGVWSDGLLMLALPNLVDATPLGQSPLGELPSCAASVRPLGFFIWTSSTVLGPRFGIEFW